jgi:hypothetical protein
MVASTGITPGCVQFLKNKKRFHTAWTQSGPHRECNHAKFCRHGIDSDA